MVCGCECGWAGGRRERGVVNKRRRLRDEDKKVIKENHGRIEEARMLALLLDVIIHSRCL